MTIEQDSILPVTSVSDSSNDSSISVLQSKVASFKGYIHNMHAQVQYPPPPQPQLFPQPPSWTQPYGMLCQLAYQGYAQQVSPYPIHLNTN